MQYCEAVGPFQGRPVFVYNCRSHIMSISVCRLFALYMFSKCYLCVVYVLSMCFLTGNTIVYICYMLKRCFVEQKEQQSKSMVDGDYLA